jgi:hypothetical protein
MLLDNSQRSRASIPYVERQIRDRVALTTFPSFYPK